MASFIRLSAASVPAPIPAPAPAAMNMGRSNFYRKLKGILNMSPNEYLRLFRLKQAASILKEGTYGVVEVSYMVGFSTPSYFSSCFKKQFGVLPKDFISH